MKILSGVSPSAIRGLLGARPQNGETRGEALYSRIRDSVSESMHGRVARVRVRRRSKRRKKKEEKRSVCRTSAASIEESGANNLANCRQRIFKFEHRISLGPPARGHRVNQSGESSALVRVTKNRIRAFKKGKSSLFLSLSLSFSPPPQPASTFACEKASLRRTDSLRAERILVISAADRLFLV